MLLRSHNMNNEFKPLVVFSAIFIVIIGVIAFVLSAQNRRLREQTATAPSNQVVAPTSQPEKVTPIAEEDYTEGLVDTAPVVLVTYADLNCSFCKIYHQTIQGVLDDYGDQVAYVFRHFPIVGSVQQAQAAECVGKAGGNEAFLEFVDRYFAEVNGTSRSTNPESAKQLAADMGFDISACLESGETAELVDADSNNAGEIGIAGTPSTVMINRAVEPAQYQLLQGAYSRQDLDILLTTILDAVPAGP